MALIYDERIREKYGPEIALQLEEPVFDADYGKYRYHFIIWHRGTGAYKCIWFDDLDEFNGLLKDRPDIVDGLIDRVLEMAEKDKAKRKEKIV